MRYQVVPQPAIGKFAVCDMEPCADCSIDHTHHIKAVDLTELEAQKWAAALNREERCRKRGFIHKAH